MIETKDITGKIESVRQFLIPRAYPDVYENFDDLASALLLAVEALERVVAQVCDDEEDGMSPLCKRVADKALSTISSLLPPQK